MKKQLLGTSALAAVGMIAATGAASAQTAPASQPIQVTVGGYMDQFLTYTSQDNRTNANGAGANTAKAVKVQVNNDSEIWFQGKTTLANGISVGMRVELEANTESDQIDRSFAFVEGAFGRIEIGSTANAGNTMGVHAPDPLGGMAIAGVMGMNSVIQPQTSGGLDTPATTTLLRFTDNDAEKVNYYTPRFEGFQLGLTYIPEVTQDRGGYNAPRFTTNTYNQGYGVGLNFTRAFGPVDIQASAGYLHFQKPDTNANSSNATLSDPSAYTFGAQVGYAGFRVGGSYLKTKDYANITAGQTGAGSGMTGAGWSGSTSGVLNQGSSYDLGLTYTFGPATVGIDYFHGKNDGNSGIAGSDVIKAGAISGSYTLGPGVKVQAAVFQVKITGENASSNDDNKATGLTTGLLLNF